MKMTTIGRWTKRTLMGTVLLAVAAPGIAQISLNSAVDLALRNDPRVKSAQAGVTKAEAVVAESKDVYIPNLAMKGGYGVSSGPPLGVPVVFSLQSDSLLFNFSQKDNIRAASDGLKSAKLALLDAQQQTAEDVVVNYITLDNAEQRYKALMDEQQHAGRLVSIVQDRLDAGEDTRMELLRSQRTSKQIQLAALNVEDEIAQATYHLAGLMGMPGETTLATVPESIPSMPVPHYLDDSNGDSVGVKASFAQAQSKQEVAFGDARYRYRPQVGFGANYSRISTTNTSYNLYYPGFSKGRSDNALAIYVSISIPIFDYEHMAHARESAADAARAIADAQNDRLKFFEGRNKLRHSVIALQTKSEIAQIDQEIAQDQIETILIQLNGSNNTPGAVPMTPKDEQNARVQERQRQVDLLSARQQLNEAEVNLMRQSGTLADWLKQAVTLNAPTPSSH